MAVVNSPVSQSRVLRTVSTSPRNGSLFYAAKYLAVAELFEILLFHVFHRLAVLDGKPPQNQMQIAVLTERALGLSLGKLHNAAPFIEGIAPALETLAVEFCSEIVEHTQKGSPSGSSS